ncbi:hypothetical protein [Erythrobacter tepidarius]|uniref:hypothetical protein n=1 Tax=Erythrobacter tepidarius TaxID=60454 RepID=UPI000A36AEA5|nr:hypothetical protein [Erythrobacter tepidarius]
MRIRSLTALIAAARVQSACATNSIASTCKATGSLATLPGMDAGRICDRFERNLADGLGSDRLPQDLTITLTLHPRGAIDAQLTRAGVTYPVISVDALDRVLGLGQAAATTTMPAIRRMRFI